MKKEVIGTCKLCLTERVRLVESHLMPAGFFRRLLSEQKNPHPLLFTAKGSRSSSEQITDNVLCEQCEARFGTRGEDYALRMAATKNGFPLLKELLVNASRTDSEFQKSTIMDSPTVKRDHLVYFALSVFWRAAVHEWPDSHRTGRTAKLQLGDGNTEMLRRFLLGETAISPTMNLLLFVLTDRLSQATLNMPTRTSREDFRWGYGFLACGYLFYLFLGKNLDPAARRTCLIHSPERFIFIRDGEQKTLQALGHIQRQQRDKLWPK